jgi:dienelactone hydrolase
MGLTMFQKLESKAILLGAFCVMLCAVEARPQVVAADQSADNNLERTFTVSKTFNNAPFDYTIKLLSRRDGYRVYQIKFPSPVKSTLQQNNTVPAEYYVPDGVPPDRSAAVSAASSGHDARAPRRPAVICMHILDGNDALTDLLCSVLALRGVPAIMFRLPYYGERGLADGPMILTRDPELFTSAVEQAGEDVRRTIDLLAARPEIDPEHIGITGISLGGIIAATAAGGEPRINRASLILAGGDLMSIIRHARETRPLSEMIESLSPDERAQVEKRIAAVDPLRFAAALRDKARQGKITMVNAAEDEVIPRASTEKLAAAMELGDRVVWLDGLGHYTSMAELPRVLKMTAEFFAQDLPVGAKPPVVENKPTPVRVLAQALAQAAEILDGRPQKGRCYAVDFTLAMQAPNQTEAQTSAGTSPAAAGAQEGRLRLVRGADARFAFYCKLPGGIEISAGQNAFPWMTTGAKEVIEGVDNPGPTLKDPRELLGARQVALMRMLTGILNSISLAPDVLDRLIAAKDGGIADGMRAIQITGRERMPGAVRLLVKTDTNAPESATFNVSGVEGSIRFHRWQINAAAEESLFQPPSDLPRRQVDESFLYTLFSTSLRYILGAAG